MRRFACVPPSLKSWRFCLLILCWRRIDLSNHAKHFSPHGPTLSGQRGHHAGAPVVDSGAGVGSAMGFVGANAGADDSAAARKRQQLAAYQAELQKQVRCFRAELIHTILNF